MRPPTFLQTISYPELGYINKLDNLLSRKIQHKIQHDFYPLLYQLRFGTNCIYTKRECVKMGVLAKHGYVLLCSAIILFSSFIGSFLLSVNAHIANILGYKGVQATFLRFNWVFFKYYYYICVTNQSIVIHKQIKTYGIAKD